MRKIFKAIPGRKPWMKDFMTFLHNHIRSTMSPESETMTQQNKMIILLGSINIDIFSITTDEFA